MAQSIELKKVWFDRCYSCESVFETLTSLTTKTAQYKYAKYCELRDLYGDCSLERVAPVLGMGTIHCDPRARDNEGHAILFVVTENLIPALDRGRQRVRAMTFLMELVLEDPQVQEKGFVSVLDFANTPFSMNNQVSQQPFPPSPVSSFSHYVIKKAQKDLNELFDALPSRFAAGHICNPPYWFSIAFRIVKAITSSKLIARVTMLSRPSVFVVVVDIREFNCVARIAPPPRSACDQTTTCAVWCPPRRCCRVSAARRRSIIARSSKSCLPSASCRCPTGSPTTCRRQRLPKAKSERRRNTNTQKKEVR